MKRLQNKIALITGAAQGIGLATAKLFAKNGAKVLLTDINEEEVLTQSEKMKLDYPDQILAIKHDVTSADDWKTAVNYIDSEFGGINILVNNAGIMAVGTIEDETFEQWKHVHNIDLDSVFLGCKYTIPIMKKEKKGSIINVSSIDGTQAGSTRNVPYSISKAAISHLSRIMAVHHGRQNIRVNCVAPGHVYGAFPNRFKKMEDDWRELRKKAGPLGTEGTAWDVAWAVVYLASDEAKWVTGVILPVDAGVQAASPLSMLGDIIGSDEPKSNLY